MCCRRTMSGRRPQGPAAPAGEADPCDENVAIPTVTLFGLQLPSLLGGAMILEKIFSLKGVGAVAIEAITNRDYPVILGSVLYTATILW